MPQQFWINEYFIDCSRNQISHNNIVTNIPSKAMAVLNMLVENSDQVVGHESIMASVWQDSIVAPNSLQRCITQLRKALGDNSKQQTIIKTHSKLGYSLIADVKPHQTTANKVNKSHISSAKNTKYALSFISLVLCIFITFYWFEDNSTLNFNQVKPLTYSDERESNGQYSPDGRYIVFQRNITSCESHIWAKDLQTHEEFKLTKKSGIYGTRSWSQDGNQLAFVAQSHCQTIKSDPQQCWQLVTLDFAKALKSPQDTTTRLVCNNQQAASARWLPEGQIGFLRQHENQLQKIQAYNPRTEQLTDLYTPHNTYIYSYDYSFANHAFAVISTTKNKQHIVEKLNMSGEVLSRAILKPPEGLSFNDNYYIHYHPFEDYLITATHEGLFQIFFDGSLKRINGLNQHGIYSPSVHPNGKKILVTQAMADSDMALIKLNQSNVSKLKLHTIARSNSSDINGQFQPKGNNIAFISKRSGKRQLWLFDGKNSKQISQLKYGIQSVSFAWSNDGQHLIGINKNKLIKFDLKGGSSIVDIQLSIQKILQWTIKNHLLVLSKQDNQSILYQVDMSTLKVTKLINKDIEWANLTDDNTLIYVDTTKRFWVKKDKTDEFPGLSAHLDSNIFALENNELFGINKHRELWSYSLSSKSFKVLQQLPDTARYVSDVNNAELLFTQMINYQKELIELH
ncbi:winged helix-turn-helix domain-containing protein [Pseudoalteromonas sp. C2R02]|nr:winged helix-turn-helix domain-containing protein [Pseudoalteromonas sp. C2R02]